MRIKSKMFFIHGITKFHVLLFQGVLTNLFETILAKNISVKKTLMMSYGKNEESKHTQLQTHVLKFH